MQSTLENQRRSNPNINIDQVRNSVWNQIIKETILNKEYVELGVKVGSNELFDMIQEERIHILLLNNLLQIQKPVNLIELDFYNF